MRRRLFAVVSAFSLLLCFATLALWVRSYWSHDTLGCRTVHIGTDSMDSWFYGLNSSKGVLLVAFNTKVHITDVRDVPNEREGTHFVCFGNLPVDMHHLDSSDYWHGFSCDFSHHPGTNVSFDLAEIGFPLWLLVMLTAILPSLRAIRFVQRHRIHKLHHCLSCGYNLTGNVSGVCPECGTPVPKELADKSPRPA